MNINELTLSEPMADISSERAIALGDLYDDFAKHCCAGMERPAEAAASV